MALVHGDLVDHINNVFHGGPRGVNLWERLADIEDYAANLLHEYTGAPVTDRFQLPLRDLPKDLRDEVWKERRAFFNIDALLGADRMTIDELSQAPSFVIRKAPELSDTGYGSFHLPRSEFIGRTPEEVREKLSLISSNVELSLGGDQRIDLRLSGAMNRTQFLDDTAQHVSNIGNIRNARRLVFDVETAGLELDKGIWQLSARLMEGDQVVRDAQGKERVINLLFDNPAMDTGFYGLDDQGNRITFRQHYESVRRAAGDTDPIEWIARQDFDKGLMRFFDLANDADYLVGQNTAFDVRHLIRGMQGKANASPEFAEAVARFHQQVDAGKVVDTRMLSMMVFGENNLLDVAGELKRIDKYTPHSMENILLQSNFLEQLAGDLDARGLNGWQEIQARIAMGMHHGDVDTWFENELFRMQSEILSGQRPDILTNTPLADKRLRGLIADASSITPFTKVAALGDLTPIEFMTQHERRLAGDLVEQATSGQLRHAGLYRDWADSILTSEGKIAKVSRLADSGFDVVQAQALKEGLPFAGLSSAERLISTVIGRHAVGEAPGNINRRRHMFGDLTGGGVIRKAERAGIYGGQNVALPLELIMEAERQGALTSKFHTLADEASEVQLARWSVFEWGTGEKDVALVADILSGKEDVDSLIDFLRKMDPKELSKYGISQNELAEYADVLTRYGQKRGIQLGIMGGRGNASVAAITNLVEQLGFGIDSKDSRLLTAVVDAGGTDELLHTTATFIDTGDIATDANLRANVRLTQDIINQTLDPDLDPNVIRAVKMGRGDPARANRVYSFLERNMPAMPRRLGYAGAAIAGYYLYGKMQDRRAYQDTMAPQEYEEHDFYERYKADMGEQVPTNYRTRPSQHSLATAGVVGNLDRNKIGHHQMGPNKHSHLFGG